MQRISIAILCLFLGFYSETAVADTQEECIQNLQEILISCYDSCEDSSDEVKCRKACRKHYRESLSSCKRTPADS